MTCTEKTVSTCHVVWSNHIQRVFIYGLVAFLSLPIGTPTHSQLASQPPLTLMPNAPGMLPPAQQCSTALQAPPHASLVGQAPPKLKGKVRQEVRVISNAYYLPLLIYIRLHCRWLVWWQLRSPCMPVNTLTDKKLTLSVPTMADRLTMTMACH
jgi:hypothetical protein